MEQNAFNPKAVLNVTLPMFDDSEVLTVSWESSLQILTNTELLIHTYTGQQEFPVYKDKNWFSKFQKVKSRSISWHIDN